jgi:hypothetical protein
LLVNALKLAAAAFAAAGLIDALTGLLRARFVDGMGGLIGSVTPRI